MKHVAAETQAVLIDGAAGYDLVLGEGAIHVQRFDDLACVIPLRRISRVLLRQPRSGTLKALLELTDRGVPVHFQDGRGNISATLIMADLPPPAPVRELIAAVEGCDPRRRYRLWLELQLRHAASRILRGASAGGVETFENRLGRYAAQRVRPEIFASTWNEISALAYAWIDGELTRLRMRQLVDALGWHQCALLRDLDRIIAIPLLWKLAPWLRVHSHHRPVQRMEFFEHARGALEVRLALHLAALEFHLRPSHRSATAGAGTRRRFRRTRSHGPE